MKNLIIISVLILTILSSCNVFNYENDINGHWRVIDELVEYDLYIDTYLNKMKWKYKNYPLYNKNKITTDGRLHYKIPVYNKIGKEMLKKISFKCMPTIDGKKYLRFDNGRSITLVYVESSFGKF